jgi:hypothetical protein
MQLLQNSDLTQRYINWLRRIFMPIIYLQLLKKVCSANVAIIFIYTRHYWESIKSRLSTLPVNGCLLGINTQMRICVKIWLNTTASLRKPHISGFQCVIHLPVMVTIDMVYITIYMVSIELKLSICKFIKWDTSKMSHSHTLWPSNLWPSPKIELKLLTPLDNSTINTTYKRTKLCGKLNMNHN